MEEKAQMKWQSIKSSPLQRCWKGKVRSCVTVKELIAWRSNQIAGLKWEVKKPPSFPTERIIKLNSSWKDMVEPKRVSKLKKDWMSSWIWSRAIRHWPAHRLCSGAPRALCCGRMRQWKLIILTLLPKPLVPAAVRWRTLSIFAKSQANHRDAKFYKQ